MSGAGVSAVVGEAIFWVAVLSSAVAELLILRAVVRGRGGAAAPTAAGATLPTVRRGVEILWAILPALLLAGVLVLTWRAMRTAHEPPPPGARATSIAARPGDPA